MRNCIPSAEKQDWYACPSCLIGHLAIIGHEPGCGTHGQIAACYKCRSVFRNTAGGMAPPDSPEWEHITGASLDEYFKKDPDPVLEKLFKKGK